MLTSYQHCVILPLTKGGISWQKRIAQFVEKSFLVVFIGKIFVAGSAGKKETGRTQESISGGKDT